MLKTNSYASITLYCDDESKFSAFKRYVNVVQLDEIKTLGVKRAKFLAYYDAIKKGDFLYLDSDIVVLDSIEELFEGRLLKGCKDTLESANNFIIDPKYPWVKESRLENKSYINSGVFFAPKNLKSFFKKLLKLSSNDSIWNKYIIDGYLYDNHFLCAFINKLKIKVNYIDCELYNWQGFHNSGELKVEYRENKLVNKANIKQLKILHFAGITDINMYLLTLPIEVTSLILFYGSGVISSKKRHRGLDFIESLNKNISQAKQDPFIFKVFTYLLHEVGYIVRTKFNKNYEKDKSYFRDKESIISLAYSLPITDNIKWNRLKSGGAYLHGDEYNFLKNILNKYNINTLVETGAGETSILFKKLKIDAYSIEAHEGPWLERARQKGCKVFQIDFNEKTRLFSNLKLKKTLAPLDKNVDLIFIDSPGGTLNRSKIFDQIQAIVEPKYILFHDVKRDSGNIYNYLTKFNLEVVDYYDSARGIILFKFNGLKDYDPLLHLDNSIHIDEPMHSIRLGKNNILKNKHINITIKNKSKYVYSSRYINPVLISYHTLDMDKNIINYDGIRSDLPFDLYPGDNIDTYFEFLSLKGYKEYIMRVDLVQEGLYWLGEKDKSNILDILINTDAGTAIPLEN